MSGSSSQKKVAIIGARGRLGSSLVKSFGGDFEIIPVPRDGLDFAHPEKMESILAGIECDLLINTAAYTNVDACEDNKEEAFAVNGHAVGVIGRHMADRGIRVIHFSTDYVFDGEKEGGYTEEDAPNPVSVYGESKLLGETQLLEASGVHLVVRVCWVFGPGRPGFPEWIVDMMIANESFSVVEDKTGSPTYTEDCAEALKPLLFGEAAVGGIMHLANAGVPTWQEWAQRCVDAAGANGAPLKAKKVGGVPMDSITAFKAKRPRHSALAMTRYQQLIGRVPRSWEAAVDAHFADYYRAPQPAE